LGAVGQLNTQHYTIMSRNSKTWNLMEWVSNPHAQSQRLGLRGSLHKCKDYGSYEWYISTMTQMWECFHTDVFVWAFIDSPEAYRQRALQDLKDNSPTLYDEVISSISALQGKDASAQGIDFQCVAVPEYLSTLPASAQQCSHCKKGFPEGADMIWRPCKKHACCLDCLEMYSSRSLKLRYYSCPCIAPEALKCI
jgi:hypothetical protein